MKKRQAPGVARRTLLVGGAAAASLGWLARPARASTIESARIVLGAPAGGSGDLMARKLADKVEHHLQEEEHRFFQMAGKLLTEKQKITLAARYQADYDEAKATTV